jgi:hypothetical protein
MEIRHELNPSPIIFERLPRIGEDRFLPDLSEYISHQNYIFLDQMAGGSHDVNVIRELIGRINERSKDAYKSIGRREMGIGVILHRMREIHDSQIRNGRSEDFDILLNKVLGNISTEFCRVAEE